MSGKTYGLVLQCDLHHANDGLHEGLELSEKYRLRRSVDQLKGGELSHGQVSERNRMNPANHTYSGAS